ncbi:hypothetical protein MKK75_07060, partial [Methylobacterium sp. J-030]|nr:hypothetical protein [Methylobacterium sp. J-030]
GMTLAIGHAEGERAILDAVREIRSVSADAIVEEFSTLCKASGVRQVVGDRYAGEWPRERFQMRGITSEVSERSKSYIDREFLPLLNSRRCRLLDVPNLQQPLVSLDRPTTRRRGKDIIHHPQMKGAHDDVANAVAGVLVSLQKQPGDYDPDMWARLLDD